MIGWGERESRGEKGEHKQHEISRKNYSKLQ